MPEENLDDLINDETAQKEAVRTLIGVKQRKSGDFGSDIELKTELNDSQICIHTAVDMVAHFLSMKSAAFQKEPILELLTNLKERKLLSRNRQSRKEIVDVARSPDMITNNQQSEGFVRSFFKSKRNI